MSQNKLTALQEKEELRVTKYVDKLVQGTLVKQVLIHWIAFVVATTLIVATLTWMTDPFLAGNAFVRTVIVRLCPIALTALFLVPLFVKDTVDFSHRMVGPMVRVRRELKKLAIGQKAVRMEFRPNDYWQDVAGEFNNMCDYVEGHQL